MGLGLGFGVLGLSCGGRGFGYCVLCLGSSGSVCGLGLRGGDLRCRVWCVGCRVRCERIRVKG